MKTFLRRGAVLLAATMTCATLLPVAGANAVGGWSPCDNEVNPPTPLAIGPLPANLGFVYIQTQSEDVYVQYDGPGTLTDVQVGADLQTLSLNEDTAVCVTVAGIGIMVEVNVVNLEVNICQFTGQPYTAIRPCLFGSWDT